MNVVAFEAIQSNLEALKQRDIELKQQKAELEKRIAHLHTKEKNLTENNLQLNQVSALLTAAADTSRKNAKDHFEKIVTDALQFVTQNRDYEFVIQELPGRAKASYEFYIRSTVNGVTCLQKPEDANGGGFVDIISVAAKYAYLEIFNDPKIMSGTLLYDEPGKMISADMSIKFAEYLKFLGNHYNRQTIMITHNETLSNVADKTFVVKKNQQGISTVADHNTVLGQITLDTFQTESQLIGDLFNEN